MNKLKTAIIAISMIIFGSGLRAQGRAPKIDPQTYVDALNNFYIQDLCADTVLLTSIGKRNDSYGLAKKDISKFIKKRYNNKESKFEWNSSSNAGRVITLSQYSKNSEIPVRFFVLFLSYTNDRIVVIEVEENK